MKYIAIVHKDTDSVYGVTLPDFPGCFAATENWENLTHTIQEAVELWAEGEEIEPPVASDIESVSDLEDAKNGILFVVDVNFDFLESKVVPVNITMPVYMKNRIDRMAKAKGLSRSAFLVKAVEALA